MSTSVPVVIHSSHFPYFFAGIKANMFLSLLLTEGKDVERFVIVCSDLSNFFKGSRGCEESGSQEPVLGSLCTLSL